MLFPLPATVEIIPVEVFSFRMNYCNRRNINYQMHQLQADKESSIDELVAGPSSPGMVAVLFTSKCGNISIGIYFSYAKFSESLI